MLSQTVYPIRLFLRTHLITTNAQGDTIMLMREERKTVKIPSV